MLATIELRIFYYPVFLKQSRSERRPSLYKINCKPTCCFAWVWNIVSSSKKQIEGVWERSSEKDIWA
jgi:hypothetical protein